MSNFSASHSLMSDCRVTPRRRVLGRGTDKLLCQECDELRLGVPGLCLGETGVGVGKRCKWLIIKPLKWATTAENPRVGGSIPPPATTNFLNSSRLAIGLCREPTPRASQSDSSGSFLEIQNVVMKSAEEPTAKGELGIGVSSPVSAFSSKPVTRPSLPSAT